MAQIECGRGHLYDPDKYPTCPYCNTNQQITVAAAGRTGLITVDMEKEGAVVVDVAMNRNEAGKLCGDVDYAAAAERASYITPVPGGVGPMTRAMLMENTLYAARTHGKC